MYRYLTHLFELIYDKNGFITLNNIVQEKGVNANTVIINLQDLINQINANPPIFKEPINEEDEIEYLRILNRLRKNNKDNISEDELEELALLQLKRNKNKTEIKSEPKQEIQEEVVREVIQEVSEEKESRFGEIVRTITNPLSLKKIAQATLDNMRKNDKNGIKFDDDVYYLFELSDDDVININLKAQELKKDILLGQILEIPYKFTAEALKDPTIKQQILNDKVVLTQDQIKYAPKPEGMDQIKKIGKMGRKVS